CSAACLRTRTGRSERPETRAVDLLRTEMATTLRKSNTHLARASERSPARKGAPAMNGNGIELTKSDATRRRILDAAALVMSREGFAGTKLSDIASEADVKIATLYYYFPSREDLVQAVLVT